MPVIMKYKLIIFDFDGTLADSFPWFLNFVDSVSDKYKLKRIEQSQLETLRGYDAQKMIRHLKVPFWKVPLIANHMRTSMTNDIDRISLFDGVPDMLKQLSQNGVTLALVSSNSLQNVRRVLGPENAALISYYECGVSLFGKRSRFRRILAKTGIARSEALCVGDEIRDIAAAHEERIPFGAVAWGYTNIEAMEAYAPAEVFTSVGDIARILSLASQR
jgi:phosphoglycolate phosphatase